jgi:carbamoyl-phosphate synthase small subunit
VSAREAYVLLEDGRRFDGEASGADTHATGEVVFTTGMSGYQESMTDPSFARQLITFTYPHIGNYGASRASTRARSCATSAARAPCAAECFPSGSPRPKRGS